MSTHPKLLFFMLILIWTSGINSQVETPFRELKLDSLLKVNKDHKKKDEAKLKILNQLSLAYMYVNTADGIEISNEAIALGEKLNNPLLLAEAYHHKGLHMAGSGDADQAMALYEKALAINQKLNNKYGIALNTYYLGDVYKRKSDSKRALEYFEKALSLFEEIKNQDGIARAYNGIGMMSSGNPAKAMEFFEKALAINEKIGNRSGMALNYNGIGVLYNSKSDYPKAIEFYQKAFSLNEQAGNLKVMAMNFMNIGLAYQNMSDYPNALEQHQKSLAINEQLGDQHGITMSLGNIGAAYSYLSDYPKAMEHYQKALAICEKTGNQNCIAQNYMRIGNIYGRLPDLEKALEFHLKSLAINEQLNIKKDMAGSYLNIGLVYYNMSDYPKALEYYQKGLTLNKETGNKNFIAMTFGNIGAAYEKTGDFALAIDYFQKALSLNDSIGNKIGIAMSLGNIGNVYRDAPISVLHQLRINPSDRFRLALKYQQQFLQISREIGAVEQELDALGNLARTYELQKDFANAFSTFQNYISIRDSIEGVKTKDQITRKEIQHEFAAKETELKFQQQLTDEQLAKQQFINKQRLQIYLLGLIAFVGIIGLLITRLWYARKNQALLKKQKEIEQREASRLTELDKLKTNLYTSITHEFRTPLTLILGPVRKLLHQPNKVSTSDMVTNLNLVEENGKRLLSLVNQILDIQKLEARQLAPQYEQADIMAFLHYLVDSFQSLVERKNISLEFQSHPDEMMMDYDKDKLQKICSNLLANAVKFTPDSGSIKFIVKADDQWLDIDVIDTGIGIPKENLETIFNLFYQVDNTTTRRQDGTGIGLTLVKELVELLGGKISVDSEPNKGSAFHVRLPVRNNSAFSENRPIQSWEEIPQLSNALVISTEALSADINNSMPLILVVEDNPDVARYLGTCLEGTYRIEYAVDGREGIERAIELIPDIVISDVMMPEADGFEVCRFLKEDSRTSHIPVILLTALSDVGDRLEGLRRGADAYLTKPFYEEELLITIEQLLKLRHILRHRYADLSIIGPATELGVIHDELIISPSSKPNENFDWPMEDAFMIRVLAVITDHMDNAEFTVEHLNKKMGMSNTQLFRKLKALTDLSANQLIRHVRLVRAKELLHKGDFTVAEIAYQTGFTNPSYFTRIFSREVGVTPTEYMG